MSEFEFAALVGLDWGDKWHEVAVWDEQRKACTCERITEAAHVASRASSALTISR